VLPDDIPWDIAVLVSGDGLGVPFHTSTKISSSDIRQVAILGIGPIGLGNALLQSYLGREVTVVDVSEARLTLGQKLGARHAVNAKDGDVVGKIRDLSGGEGADVCIEAAGRPETAKQCFAAVRPGGTVVFNGEQPSVELSPSTDFIRRDIAAVGAWYYHFCEFTDMVDLYRNGLRVKDLISAVYPLDEAHRAYQDFASGTSGKVLLQMKPVAGDSA
jgi:threonine dehydrogenase-like Zn-dependent dehydrogenase